MKNYCVYCFSNYLAFFIPIAVFMAITVFANLDRSKPEVKLIWPLLLVLIFIPGAFLGSLGTVGRWIMDLPAPRFKGGSIQPGSTELWKLFENRLGYSYDQLLPVISVAFGLGMALLFLLLTASAFRFLRRKTALKAGNMLFTALVVLGFLLMPSRCWGRCRMRTLAAVMSCPLMKRLVHSWLKSSLTTVLYIGWGVVWSHRFYTCLMFM